VDARFYKKLPLFFLTSIAQFKLSAIEISVSRFTEREAGETLARYNQFAVESPKASVCRPHFMLHGASGINRRAPCNGFGKGIKKGLSGVTGRQYLRAFRTRILGVRGLFMKYHSTSDF
jgi:hypothetical protein